MLGKIYRFKETIEVIEETEKEVRVKIIETGVKTWIEKDLFPTMYQVINWRDMKKLRSLAKNQL